MAPRFFSDLLNLKDPFLAGLLIVTFGTCNKFETWACSKSNRFRLKVRRLAGPSFAVEFVIFNYQSPTHSAFDLKYEICPSQERLWAKHCWVFPSLLGLGFLSVLRTVRNSGIAFPHLPHPPWILLRNGILCLPFPPHSRWGGIKVHSGFGWGVELFW